MLCLFGLDCGIYSSLIFPFRLNNYLSKHHFRLFHTQARDHLGRDREEDSVTGDRLFLLNHPPNAPGLIRRLSLLHQLSLVRACVYSCMLCAPIVASCLELDFGVMCNNTGTVFRSLFANMLGRVCLAGVMSLVYYLPVFVCIARPCGVRDSDGGFGAEAGETEVLAMCFDDHSEDPGAHCFATAGNDRLIKVSTHNTSVPLQCFYTSCGPVPALLS